MSLHCSSAHIKANLTTNLFTNWSNICSLTAKVTTGQPRLSAIVQTRRLSLFGHIARMPDETDARSIITASPSEDWRRPPGRPRSTWMKTIQQDLNNLSLDEAITVAQNRPRRRRRRRRHHKLNLSPKYHRHWQPPMKILDQTGKGKTLGNIRIEPQHTRC